MLVFIDESGDSGLKLQLGSSKFFVVVGVIFSDRRIAEACDLHIQTFRTQLNLSPHKEFHFSQDNERIRELFLREIDQFDFKYTAFVLNKSLLTSPGFQHRESVYKFTARMVCSNLRDELLDATVVIDRCGDKEFQSQLARYLNHHMNDIKEAPRIKKTKMEKSHSNNLLQLADMVCGAVAKSFTSTRKDRMRYRGLISQHELRVQVWPN